MKAAPSPLQLSFASGSKPVSMATDAFDLDEEPYSPAYSSFSSDESSDDSDLESRATPSDYDSSQQHPTSRSFICPILTPKHCDLLYSSRGLEKCTNRIAQMLGRETPALEMQPHYDENSEIRRQRLIAWLNHDGLWCIERLMIWCFRGKIPETAYYNAIMNIDRFLATRPEEKEPLAEKEIRPVAMVCTILGIKSIFDGTSTEAPAPYFNQLRKGGTVFFESARPELTEEFLQHLETQVLSILGYHISSVLPHHYWEELLSAGLYQLLAEYLGDWDTTKIAEELIKRCHANLRKNLDAGVIRQYKASEAAGHAVMSAIKSLAEEIMVDSLERRRLLLETTLLVTEQLNMPHKGVVVRYFRTFSTRTKDRTWVSGM